MPPAITNKKLREKRKRDALAKRPDFEVPPSRDDQDAFAKRPTPQPDRTPAADRSRLITQFVNAYARGIKGPPKPSGSTSPRTTRSAGTPAPAKRRKKRQ